jgi:tetrahydromethanopterin S-methyltransferase subunit G
METVRDKWTDERLDDLNKRVDDGFDRIDERFNRVDDRFDRLEGKMDAQFGRIDARLDSMGRAIVFGSIAFSSSMIAGFVAIATQL